MPARMGHIRWPFREVCAAWPACYGAGAGRRGPCARPATGRPRTRPVQTVSAVRRTASTASTTKAANQARIVMYAVAGTEWLLIRSVPIRVIW